MGPPCDGKAKKTAIAARMSKAPVVWRANREVLFDGVSWPNRCGAATLMRWVADGVTRSPSIAPSSSYQIRHSPYVGFNAELGDVGVLEGGPTSVTHEAQQWFPNSTSNWLKRLFRVANKCPSPECPSPSELVNDCQHATLVLGSNI